jgi:hypothetical protein
MSRFVSFGLLFCLLFVSGFTKPPWQSDPAQWTETDAEHVLYESPWAQTVAAGFPDPRDHTPIPANALPGAAEAGMKNTRAVSDGRWDGGVGINNGGGLPTLPVLVRWESSELIREARQRLTQLKGAPAESKAKSESDDYVVSITGLIPPAKTNTKAALEKQSSTDDGTESASAHAENLLENFMSNSYLQLRTGAVLRPHNAQIDAESGLIRLYFARTTTIELKDKEVTLGTRYGSFAVKKRFRLSDLSQNGKLKI